MARKDDAARDKPARRLLEQLNTYTVGAPPGGTGDALPDAVFDVAAFDTIKNQINLQLVNLEALNMLNTLGQITSMQSQSGPIPNTGVVKATGALTSTGKVTLFQPDPGQVYQVMAMSMDPEGSGAYRGIGTLDDRSGGGMVELFDTSGTGSAEALSYDTPLYIDHELYLTFNVITVDTSLQLKAALIRVR